ncbi:PREDICTED: mRNA-capping enzyme isoform X1 [Rhagoletis zephyria]|uniref:mRNA-capping enzyme isoform X1 n=1 Tax=Rhagoletis zephyria TaxID=28612 RepID=UPI0008114F1A|nr:PREDICTED: mRNA-capping enzyme isoform X1 [Rhagoletis zephyria]
MSRNSRGGPGPLPNRWLHCPRKSEKIIAERFLAFKTPLSNAFDDQMPIECLFRPEMIFSYCKTIKIKLGLWIDLTNTKRFYDRQVVEKNDAQYVKLQCRGHGETPSPEQTQSFIEIVDNFINERPFDIVAVHCTHGFNRTGFLIASYLVERLDYSIETALAIFAEARPPGIYKQDYINELFRRYEDEEDALMAPALPNWCLEYDDGDGSDVNSDVSQKRKAPEMSSTSQHSALNHVNGGEGAGEDQEGDCDEDDQAEGTTQNNESGDFNGAGVSNGGNRKKKRRKEILIKNATFMSGVPGIVQVTDQPRLGELQLKVQEICSWEKNGFPGCQPVSMDKNNLKRLHEIPYMVSWKADGTRYMMLINKRDEIYFFDRNNSCFQVENLTFVKAGNLDQHLENTLLDGEMVIDKLNGQSIPRYLIYDIVTLSNNDIGTKPFFPDRLRCIRKEIIDPRYEAIMKGLINRPLEPFSIRHKDFWDIRQSASLLGEKFAKSLLHEPDGLIFQPSKQPYTAGVCADVLKWKPFHMNSVDFRLKITVESGMGMLTEKVGLLYVGGFDQPFGKIKYTKALKDLDNKIIECSVNPQGLWIFMRERTDKLLPNSFNTAQSVCESIRHPITKSILLDFIANYGFRDDNDMMPPPQRHPHHPQTSQHHPQQQHPQQQHPQQQHRQPHVQLQQEHDHHYQKEEHHNPE